MQLVRYFLYLVLGVVLTLGAGAIMAHSKTYTDEDFGYACPITIGNATCCVYMLPDMAPTTIGKRKVVELDAQTYIVTYELEGGMTYEFWIERVVEVLYPKLLIVLDDEVTMYEYKEEVRGCWYPVQVDQRQGGFRKFLVKFKAYAREKGISERTLKVLDSTELL